MAAKCPDSVRTCKCGQCAYCQDQESRFQAMAKRGAAHGGEITRNRRRFEEWASKRRESWG